MDESLGWGRGGGTGILGNPGMAQNDLKVYLVFNRVPNGSWLRGLAGIGAAEAEAEVGILGNQNALKKYFIFECR